MYLHYKQVTFWCSKSCPSLKRCPLTEVPLYSNTNTYLGEYGVRLQVGELPLVSAQLCLEFV